MKILRITTVPLSLNVLLKGQLKFMNESGFEVTAVSANGPEVTEIKDREGVEHIVIPLTRKITPLRDLIALWKMTRLIKKLKPQIVHTHTPKAGLIGMMSAWVARTPVRIHTVAGMPLMEAKGISKVLLKLSELMTYRCATKVYPNSIQLKDWMLNNFDVSKHKVAVIGNGTSNGINTQHYDRTDSVLSQAAEIRQQLGIEQEAKVLIFVGRLVKDKGIIELVDAFSDLEIQGLHLVLVGNYEDERDPVPPHIKETINQAANIHAVGFQKDIRPYMALSDLFVFPSYREGFPNVVLQALSMQLPCVVSNINGCNEVIKDGVNGVIVEPKNTTQLQQAMYALLTNIEKFDILSNNARPSVVHHYEQKDYWQALLREYKSLLNSHV